MLQQLSLALAPPRPSAAHSAAARTVAVADRQVPLLLVRNRRARRYILRMRPNGAARVTIPRGGTIAEAEAFVVRHTAWIERQLLRQAAQTRQPASWPAGAEILFRGETVRIEETTIPEQGSHAVCVGGERIPVGDGADGAEADYRKVIERHFRMLAARELPVRVFELAARHALTVNRVSIRSQKSRWGSCSARRTISLNWRLVHAPAFVVDYLIIHELMHLRQMNHSARFWREVEEACPNYKVAERWLNEHGRLLRGGV